MSRTTTTDERGRIVIPAAFRERHGDRYRVVELRDRIELIPLSDDPVEGFRRAIGDAFDEASMDELRAIARETAEREALRNIPDTDDS